MKRASCLWVIPFGIAEELCTARFTVFFFFWLSSFFCCFCNFWDDFLIASATLGKGLSLGKVLENRTLEAFSGSMAPMPRSKGLPLLDCINNPQGRAFEELRSACCCLLVCFFSFLFCFVLFFVLFWVGWLVGCFFFLLLLVVAVLVMAVVTAHQNVAKSRWYQDANLHFLRAWRRWDLY